MSVTVALGAATKKGKGPDGKRIDVPNTNAFATGVSPENANGAPIVNGKAQVVVVASDARVQAFADYAELRSIAGEQYESKAVEVFNAAARDAQLSKARAEGKKLTVMPVSGIAWLQSVFDIFSLASLFTVQTKAAKAGKQTIKKQELAALTANAATMSKEDLLAALAALSR